MMQYFFVIFSFIMGIFFKIPFLARPLNVLLSSLATFARLTNGTVVASNLNKATRPVKPLKLYDFEGCPFCRKVRETICVLDLDVIVYPCPRETLKQYGVCKDSRFRPIVEKLGKKN
jgi:hypothetical protein